MDTLLLYYMYRGDTGDILTDVCYIIVAKLQEKIRYGYDEKNKLTSVRKLTWTPGVSSKRT